MKKIFYLFLILSLAFGLQSCGGSGGSADDPEPGPEPGATKVSFALKSDINGVQDNDLKTALTHLRLYLYDKDQKLVSVNKYTSAVTYGDNGGRASGGAVRCLSGGPAAGGAV